MHPLRHRGYHQGYRPCKTSCWRRPGYFNQTDPSNVNSFEAEQDHNGPAPGRVPQTRRLSVLSSRRSVPNGLIERDSLKELGSVIHERSAHLGPSFFRSYVRFEDRGTYSTDHHLHRSHPPSARSVACLALIFYSPVFWLNDAAA